MADGKCRLCGGATCKTFETTILASYKAEYYVCGICGLLQIDQPRWLQENFDLSVSMCDTGIVERNRMQARTLIMLLSLLRLGPGKFTDYGGGHGLFTRMMRDAGFDFRHYDPYSENIFARGFEYQVGQPVDVVTLFEVVEHLVNPKSTWEEIFRTFQPKLVVVSTETYRLPLHNDWWYLSKETGQHVSFYSALTFGHLGKLFGYHHVSLQNLHILSKTPLSAPLVRTCRYFAPALSFLFRRRSLTQDDNHAMLKLCTERQRARKPENNCQPPAAPLAP